MKPRTPDTQPLGMKLGRLASLQAQTALQNLGEQLDIRICGILLQIGTDGAHGQQEIGERLGIDRSTIMRLMRELEALHLVERHRPPENLRQIRLVLTAKGLDLHDRALIAMQQSEDHLLESLTPTERDVFLRVSVKLYAAHFTAHAQGDAND